MISFIIALVVLVVGFFTYGYLTEKVFGPDDRKTPAIEINDGVDCVPIKTWKALLIQLLNIAGTGPIFGALMGACFGPVVFLWIVFGSILGGAVHNYMSGMISCRNKGESIAELSGKYLGKPTLYVMRIFSIVLLLLTGTVFVTSPAALISSLTPEFLGNTFWIVVILIYYVFATLLPVDKVIGKLYPIFGVILIVMAVSIAGGIIFIPKYSIPEITFANLHPDNQPIWPVMFITVACGAISGFHATQSPMMAKCITSERRTEGILRCDDYRIGYRVNLGGSRCCILRRNRDAFFCHFRAWSIRNRIPDQQGNAWQCGRNSRNHRCCGLPDYVRRYGISKCQTDPCRVDKTRSEKNRKQTLNYIAYAWYQRGSYPA